MAKKKGGRAGEGMAKNEKGHQGGGESVVRLVFITVLFLLVLYPMWRIIRWIVRKVTAELGASPDQSALDALKQKRKALIKELDAEEKELKRKTKQNEKIKKGIKNEL